MNSYQVSSEIPITQISVDDEFWSERMKINSESAIFHQWEKLEESGTIDNFRIVSREIDKFREGYFYVDSDAHKWAEAAATILQSQENKKLHAILTKYLDLLISAQKQDGYIFTYNQIHFPKERWINHQIEHELYILGHLIEASIIAYKITKSESYLKLGTKAADLLVKEFCNTSPEFTPGHPEIEIALIKLYRFTKEEKYLALAKRFVNVRGKFLFFGYQILKENLSHHKRTEEANMQKETYYGTSVTNESLMSEWPQFGSKRQLLRFYLSAFTGRYLQQNKPIRRQKKPIGHCVRWGYLVTAATMIYQETGDKKLLRSLQKAWNNMVQKKMYVTGGIGSLPLSEGFGRDYELNNKFAYNETCAAISTVFWNWEMLLSTGDAKYSELLEWQLYNAVLVGMSSDGKSYFYRNPLDVEKTFERKDWYKTACCPSNISRTLANLAKYIYSFDEKNLWIHQFIGSKTQIPLNENKESVLEIGMESELPWGNKIKINLACKEKSDFYVNIRIPSWTSDPEIIVNGRKLENIILDTESVNTASGLSTFDSYYVCLKEKWKERNVIEVNFPMEVKILKSHRKVRSNKNKVALSRGPLVYCFEDKDNLDIDFKNENIDLKVSPVLFEDEGMKKLKLTTDRNREMVARPYYSWGNKGKSSMKVWIQELES
ncbi:MAG: hypothetical protein GOP50_10285 [Candidatus Heimdallarchaeota archaeon]|nr:hypothetical protein [Candidatus Heimdallarchaeota archaeon]